MDGVLTDTLSCWHFIHEHFGVSNEKSVHAYVSGEIDDLEFIRRDVNLWRKNNELISLAELKSLLDSIPLMQGAKKCIQYLKEHDVKTAIVSAGLDELANRVAHELGIDHVYANGIQTDDNGLLTTKGVLRVPLMYKDTVVRHISTDLNIPLNHMAAVGNSCYDIPMLQMASLRIAFNPSDDCICEHADVIIFGKNLEELLFVFAPYL
jgi:phosphoserine phosphatase